VTCHSQKSRTAGLVLEQHAADSEGLKQLVSTSTRPLENVLESVGGGSETLKGFGHPETNILGESFYSKAPIRYGTYIAILSIQPVSENLKELTGKHVPHLGKRYSGLRMECLHSTLHRFGEDAGRRPFCSIAGGPESVSTGGANCSSTAKYLQLGASRVSR
jgi:hypothetical protein